MKSIAMIGTKLIHTYPYGAYFNGYDPEKFSQNAKPWMQKFMQGKPSSPQTEGTRITHVWSTDRDEAKKLADACFIENIAEKVEDIPGEVDGVMVMDENTEERAALMEPFLKQGKAAYADKVLSNDLEQTKSLIKLAQQNGAPIASWSQLRFAAEGKPLQGRRGGTGISVFQVPRDKWAMYAIHSISLVHGIFGCGIKCALPLAAGKVAVVYPDETTIIINVGDKHFSGRKLYYSDENGDQAIQPVDNYKSFYAAASILANMFETGEQPIDTKEMIEAVKLVNILVERDSAGNVIEIEE